MQYRVGTSRLALVKLAQVVNRKGCVTYSRIKTAPLTKTGGRLLHAEREMECVWYRFSISFSFSRLSCQPLFIMSLHPSPVTALRCLEIRHEEKVRIPQRRDESSDKPFHYWYWFCLLNLRRSLKVQYVLVSCMLLRSRSTPSAESVTISTSTRRGFRPIAERELETSREAT